MSNTQTPTVFEYGLRTRIICGANSIKQLPSLFEGLGAKRIILISDTGLLAAGIVDKVQRVFSQQAVEIVACYTGVTADAEVNSVDAALQCARDASVDAVLAVGGGSVMDATKAVKYCLHHNIAKISDGFDNEVKLEVWPQAQPMNVHHIAVPTTAGTGAETTSVGVLYDKKENIKSVFAVTYSDADIAVLDPEMTIELPHAITVATAFDALSHSLEALASPCANPFIDAPAHASAGLIFENLPKVVNNPTDINARMAMLQASTMACHAVGWCLGPLPVHNTAHAYGALYHIPHGEANCVALPNVIESLPEFYLPNAERLAAAIGVATKGDAQQLLNACVTAIRDLQKTAKAPTTFSHYNIDKQDKQKIEQAILSDQLAAFYTINDKSLSDIVENCSGWN